MSGRGSVRAGGRRANPRLEVGRGSVRAGVGASSPAQRSFALRLRRQNEEAKAGAFAYVARKFLLREPKVKFPEVEKTWHRFSFGTERLRRFPKKIL
jgi:hypothetical protein